MLFAAVFLVALAVTTLYYARGGMLPGTPAGGSVLDLLLSAWYVPVAVAAAAGLIVQAVVLVIATIATRHSLALRLCPDCGRVFPHRRYRCDRCHKPLAPADEFTWKEREIPVPQQSDFSGESPFD